MQFIFFFFQAEDGIRDLTVTGVQTCALPICTTTGQAGRHFHSRRYENISATHCNVIFWAERREASRQLAACRTSEVSELASQRQLPRGSSTAVHAAIAVT